MTAHAGPTHMVPILVRRPSSVGKLPVTELLLNFLQEEGRAKQVGVVSVCLPHLTIHLHIQVNVQTYKMIEYI